MSDNVGTVAAIYEAFGRGDTAWIVDQMDDEVEWEPGIRATELPYLQAGRGTTHVAVFFERLADSVLITHFEVPAICDGGDTVIAELVVGGSVIGGGAIEPTREIHVWRFAGGRVVSFNHVFDMAIHEKAWAARA